MEGGVAGYLTTLEPARNYPIGPDDYERWERDLGISRAMLEHFLAPGTLTLSGTITGGRDNFLPIELTVAPMQVPEPASWAAWGLAVAGACALRRRRAA